MQVLLLIKTRVLMESERKLYMSKVVALVPISKRWAYCSNDKNFQS